MECKKIGHFFLLLFNGVIGNQIIHVTSILIHIPDSVRRFFPRNHAIKVSSGGISPSDTDTIIVIPDTDFLSIYGKSFSTCFIFLLQEVLHFFIIQTFNQSCRNMKQCIFLSTSRAENIIYYFITNGFTLGLNIVNMIFMFLGILLHGDLRRYVDAVAEAAGSASGVLLQFPFYAGIMGMMVVQNEAGVSLAGVISQFFVNISNNVTFPMLSFLAAGIVNFFVPSGGGQWAVQGPIMMPAGAELGIGAGRTAMAIAWGDQWTNMIQPFWALPALGIAKLSARDIMGYLAVVLLFVGLVACLGFLAWGLLF